MKTPKKQEKKVVSKTLRVMLHPGEITSKSDGDRHFIGGAQLANLYGVLPTDDVVTFDFRNPTHTEDYHRRHGMNFIHLYPKRDGDYHDIHEYDGYEIYPPKSI